MKSRVIVAYAGKVSGLKEYLRSLIAEQEKKGA